MCVINIIIIAPIELGVMVTFCLNTLNTSAHNKGVYTSSLGFDSNARTKPYILASPFSGKSIEFYTQTHHERHIRRPGFQRSDVRLYINNVIYVYFVVCGSHLCFC